MVNKWNREIMENGLNRHVKLNGHSNCIGCIQEIRPVWLTRGDMWLTGGIHGIEVEPGWISLWWELK